MISEIIGIVVVPLSVLILLGEYYLYLHNKRKGNWLLLTNIIVFIIVLLIYYIISKEKYLFVIYLSIFFFLIILVFVKNQPPKCENKVKKGKMENITIYECSTKDNLINAWYTPKDRSIYMSKDLIKILNNKEFSIVLRHELSHAKRKWYIYLSNLSVLSSLIIWPLTILSFIYVIISPTYILLYLSLLLFSFLLSLISSISIWIEEHEADIRAIRSAREINHFANALVKIHVTYYLDSLKPFIKNIHKSTKTIKVYIDDMGKYTFWIFIKDVFTYILRNIALSPSEIFHKDLYISHPPIKFRIMKLTTKMKTKENKYEKTKNNKGAS